VKRRYLALQIESESAMDSRELLDAIWQAITRLYGEYGASQTGLALINFNEENKTALIRVSLTMLQQVRASLVTITQIKNKQTAIHVTAISGTIKSLNENAKVSSARKKVYPPYIKQ
jgi:RNase P/RNase MRP subunit POP5